MVYLQIFCASTRNTSRLELEVILFGLRPFRASVKSKLCRRLDTRVRVLLHGAPPTEYISLNRLTSLRSLYSRFNPSSGQWSIQPHYTLYFSLKDRLHDTYRSQLPNLAALCICKGR